jgi:hypothetical protein
MKRIVKKLISSQLFETDLVSRNRRVNTATETRGNIEELRRKLSISKCSGGDCWQFLYFSVCDEITSETRWSRFILHLAFCAKRTNESSRLQLAHVLAPIPTQPIVTIAIRRQFLETRFSAISSRLRLSRYDSSEEYTALLLGWILRGTFWDVNARL